MSTKSTCFFCKECIELPELIGRREECTKCGEDLHCCFQCEFYDTAYNNSCREPQAEPVREKDRSNFCNYFHFGRQDKERSAQKESILSELDKLFKK